MTVESLLFFAKQHIHSDHAKILIAELLNCNPLELLNHLEEEVSQDQVNLLKKEIKALEENKAEMFELGIRIIDEKKFDHIKWNESEKRYNDLKEKIKALCES